MGLTHFPNGVSSYGVPLIGAAGTIPTTTGSYFWVRSTTGLSGNPGTKERPLATIAQALTKCTANAEDVIICMPGHAETISGASGIDINVAGTKIIGLGEGSLRPTLTFGAAASTIAMSAANCKLKNFICSANYADVVVGAITSAAEIVIEDVSFQEAGANLNFKSCIATDTVANSSDGLRLIRNERISVDSAALAFLSVLENITRLEVSDNFDNQASAANVGHFIILSDKTVLAARIMRNTLNLTGDNNAQTVGVFMTGSATDCTGTVAYNLVNQLDATTELFDTASLDFGHFENYMTGTVGASGYVLPAIDS